MSLINTKYVKPFSVFNLPQVVPTCAGDEFIEDFGLEYDDKGVAHPVVIGKTDIQAKVNSYRDECDMAIIVKRLIDLGVDFGSIPVEITGDDKDFNDVSDLAGKSPQELLNAINSLNANLKIVEEYKAQLQAEKDAQSKKEEVTNNE